MGIQSKCTEALAKCNKATQQASAHAKLLPDLFLLLQSLVDSAAPFATAVSCSEGDTRLEITLTNRLSGEIATRSRIPFGVLMGSWKEEGDSPTVIFKIEDTASGVRIKIENGGMGCEAITGAKEIFDAQVVLWRKKGLWDDMNDFNAKWDKRKQAAWTYWMAEEHSEDFKGTKAWKHVRSITGMWAAALIERDQFEGILQGAVCGANMLITEFEFTKLKKECQVSCKVGMDPRNTMPDHPNYDPYTSYKVDRSNDMMLNVMASEDMIGLTERFAPSAAAFGWAYCYGVGTLGGLKASKGGNPQKLAKLFERVKNPGGSTWSDLGAEDWQEEDMTYKATGEKEGRIIWTTITGSSKRATDIAPLCSIAVPEPAPSPAPAPAVDPVTPDGAMGEEDYMPETPPNLSVSSPARSPTKSEKKATIADQLKALNDELARKQEMILVLKSPISKQLADEELLASPRQKQKLDKLNKDRLKHMKAEAEEVEARIFRFQDRIVFTDDDIQKVLDWDQWSVLEGAFDRADVDNSNGLDVQELANVLKEVYKLEGVSRSKNAVNKEVALAMEEFDTDGDGNLDFNEFIRMSLSGNFKFGFTKDVVAKQLEMFDQEEEAQAKIQASKTARNDMIMQRLQSLGPEALQDARKQRNARKMASSDY